MNYTFCVRYRIRIDVKADEEGLPLQVYGIEAFDPSNGLALPLHSIPDLFTDRKRAEELVALCNSLELDPSHLHAVAEDSLI